MPALPDVAWLLYMAERLRAGARLYVDLVEVNPPLIVWLNVPAVTLAALLGCSAVLVYRCLVVATAVASFALCARVLAEVREPSDPDARSILLLLVALVVAVLAGPDFGEREHLLLLLALPYVFLVAARLEGRPVGRGLAWVVGLAAGLGIALKPYFVLLPLTLEGALLLGQPRRPLRPETLAIGIVIGAYLAAVQVWAGHYWKIAGTLGKLYYDFLQEPVLVTAVTGHGAGLVLFALLAYGTLRGPGKNPPLPRVLFLATLAWYGSAVIQRKGWRYHFYPAMSTAFLLLGLLALQARAGVTSVAVRVYRAVAAATIVFLPVSLLLTGVLSIAAPTTLPPAGDPDLPRLVDVLRREENGGGVLVLSTNMASAFPLVPLSGARWTSRYPSVWMLGAAYEDQLRTDAPLHYRPLQERTPLERELMQAVTQDFLEHKPQLIVVLRPAPDRREWGVRRLDYLRYFTADPVFARELEHYGFLRDIGEYRIYRRTLPGARPEPEPPGGAAAQAPTLTVIGPGLPVGLPGPVMVVQATAFLGLILLCFIRQSPGSGGPPATRS